MPNAKLVKLECMGNKRPVIRKVCIGEYTLSTHIVSGGDDRTVRIWRLVGEFVQLEHVFAEHIRGGGVNVTLFPVHMPLGAYEGPRA
jgi:hypothetical protein